MTKAVAASQGLRKIGSFQLFILFLSIYVLSALLIEAFFDLSNDVKVILSIADTIVCFFFLLDFFIRFFQAENKKAFMKWGWVDLVSSIPMIDIFRYGRIVRVVRILKVFRAIRSAKIIYKYLLDNKVNNAFSLLSAISILFIIVGSIAILEFEKGIDGSNITTAHDALWWAFVTITTVGYGDYYPISYEGRVIATILMVSGVGLFGTLTGFVTSYFVSDEENDSSENQSSDALEPLMNEVQELKNEIKELKKIIMDK